MSWLAMPARLLVAVIASATVAAAADAPPEWHYVGGKDDELEQQNPPRPFAADSTLDQSPIAGIYHGCRQAAFSYHFALPDGTYHLRLHYLKSAAKGEKAKAKNNADFAAAANGSVIIAHDPMWVPLKTYPDGLVKEIPPEVVPTVQEADVATKDGAIDLVLAHVALQPYWGISGIEIIGAARTIRVCCGSDKPLTDAAGNSWEPDGDHRQPIPSAGEFTIAKIDHDTKGRWIDVSHEFFKDMVEQLAIYPLPRQGALSWRVLCDHRGEVLIALSGMGCWRYDWAAGKAWRMDQGLFSGDPMYGASVNPSGAGIYLMGLYGLQQGFSSIRTLDGEHVEQISPNDHKAFAHGGTDQISVDWTSDPQVVFGVIHDYHGQTCASSDGGKTFRRFDDGDNPDLGGIGAIGGGVLLKCQKDGSLRRSADLGATWADAGKLAFSKPAGCIIQRIGDTVFLHTGAGECFLSSDLGATWSNGPATPGFHGPILRGRGEKQLIGFTSNAAYESLDLGQAWTKAVEYGPAKRFDKFAFAPWAYDPALDAFYYVTAGGIILRYAR